MTSENKSSEPLVKTDSSELVLELLERTAFECLPRLERPPTFLPADQRAQYLLRQVSEEFSELRGRVVDLEEAVEEFEGAEDAQIGELERELEDTSEELIQAIAEVQSLNRRVAELSTEVAFLEAKLKNTEPPF